VDAARENTARDPGAVPRALSTLRSCRVVVVVVVVVEVIVATWILSRAKFHRFSDYDYDNDNDNDGTGCFTCF